MAVPLNSFKIVIKMKIQHLRRLKVQLLMVPFKAKVFISGGAMVVYLGIKEIFSSFLFWDLCFFLKHFRCKELKQCFEQNTLIRSNGTFVPRKQGNRRQRQRRQKIRRGQIGNFLEK